MRKGQPIIIEFLQFNDGIYPEITSIPFICKITGDEGRFYDFLRDMIQMWNLKLEFERSLESEVKDETQKQNTKETR